MAYSYTQIQPGQYAVSQDGKTIANVSDAGLAQYGLKGPSAAPVNNQPVAPTAPAAQAPVTPTPQLTTPAAPTPFENNVSPTGGAQTAPTTTQSTTPQTATQSTSQTQPAGQLAMPANGSVVDLLNMAGQDSSFAARQQLAQQYGIQGYTGTGAQNQDLAKKYLDTYNAKKGTTTPQTASEARSALSTYSEENQATPDPTKAFMDLFSAMNPIEASIYQQLSGLLSTQSNQQSLTDLYKQESEAQGLPDLNLQLADINKIMSGTEDDIRAEITNAGGFSTESQVQALTGARNKNLLKQATYLSDVIQSKNDYVDRIVSLTQADREQVSKDLDQKLGIAQTLVTMSENMQNAAKDNLNNIVKTQGYGGLYSALQGDPQQLAQAESILGLGQGGLKNLANYTAPLSQEDQLRNQNLTLQNEKLQQDLQGISGPDLQFISGTANQPGGIFDKKTGKFTPIQSGSGPNSEQQMALSKSNIEQVDNLITSPGMAGAVGPNTLARSAPDFDFFTGVRGNFIAGVQQLTNQLTLTNLQNAKANGATFGALSEGELNLLANSASKLNTWAIKDGAGNVTGYNTTEANFKAELDKINNFAKLDYVIKGGDPSSVNVTKMNDGTLWTRNSDGTNVEIR